MSLRLGSRLILDSVETSFDSATMTAVLGPSGSGKTSLLCLIGGQLKPSRGSIQLDPLGAGLAPSWILQSSPLLTHRSALQNVMLGPRSGGASENAAEALSLLAMTELNIEHLQSQKVHKLSGGERQRVAIARTIASKSAVLLADEPTASLDPEARSAVCDAFLAARRAGCLVVIATHDPYVASRCDRVIRIADRKLIET